MEITTEDITNELAGILNEIAGVDKSKVVATARFTEDLEVDSLGMVEVVMAAEDKFGVKIPDEDMTDLRTVGDAVAYIQKSGLAR